ncbi:MAG: pseudouridine synthase [Deltaproteobacteria bacterium]|nr:pseudouridine synthase [Deltaproteobacteria bacterium]
MSNDISSTDSAAPSLTPTQFEAESQNMVGQRLDFALSLLLPQMGLRGRKRCIENGLVLVNGRACSAAQRLRKGDVVILQDAVQEPKDVAPLAETEEQSAACAPGMDSNQCEPRLLAVQGELCFFFKPAGLHTAALVGGTAPSLEGMLPQLLASSVDSLAGSCPQLLQRLDHGTSGLVCGAFSPEAADDFRRLEVAGHCEKRYVALLAGRLEEDFTVRRALRTDKRNKSRVLERDTGRTRWTEFFPLYYFDGPELNLPAFDEDSQFHRVGLTLAGCRIRRGARHQIRAHAASFGHPLWNDPLYGFASADEDADASPSVFFLHHGCLTLPGATCIVPPPWTFLPEPAARRALEWLNTGY